MRSYRGIVGAWLTFYCALLGAGPLEDMAARIQELEKKYASAHHDRPNFNGSAGLVELIQDRKFIPPGAVVHIVGPGNDPYQWILFALLRRDVKIIVFEEPGTSVFQLSSDPRYLEKLWNNLKANHPEVLKHAQIDLAQLTTLAARHANPGNRVRFLEDVTKSSTPEGTPVEKADFILALMPIDGGKEFETHAKPGALGWITTELWKEGQPKPNKGPGLEYDKRLEWKPLPVGHIATFLSPIDFIPSHTEAPKRCTKLFRGMTRNYDGRPFLFQVR